MQLVYRPTRVTQLMKARKFMYVQIRSAALVLSAVTFGAAACSAAVIPLYTNETVADIAAGTTAWDQTGDNDLGDGVNPYGVFNAPGSPVNPSIVAPPFGSGLALQMVDLSDAGKPELQGELAAPLLEPFRVDFQSINLSNFSSTQAIRFRMGNSGQDVTTESRAAFSISWQADGDVGGKYQGNDDGVPSDVDTKNSSPLDADPGNPAVHDITMIANGNVTGMWAYQAFGETRNLNPLSYDLYIDGELLNSANPGDGKYAEFINGMEFTLLNSAANYDPSLGLQRFGLFGGSTSGSSPNVLFDNIVITTTPADMGVTVPEPTSVMLLMAASAAGLVSVRRRA